MTNIDPQVSGLFDMLKKSDEEKEKRLPPDERKHKKAEREKIKARKEKRVTFDLPPALRTEIMAFAKELEIPASRIAGLAIALFIREFRAGRIDLAEYKIPARSPNYTWLLEVPEELYKPAKKK
jgi:hypothetical protein